MKTSAHNLIDWMSTDVYEEVEKYRWMHQYAHENQSGSSLCPPVKILSMAKFTRVQVYSTDNSYRGFFRVTWLKIVPPTEMTVPQESNLSMFRL